MPLRTAMPPSEMKPTRLATVSVWPVSTSASTPPMNAVGRAFRICSTIRTDGIQHHQHDEHADDRHAGQHARSAASPAAGSRTARRTRRSSLPAASPAALTRCWISATALARSRPCVLQRITIRRRAFSRLTAFGPDARRRCRPVRDSSTWPRPSGRSIRSRPRLA